MRIPFILLILTLSFSRSTEAQYYKDPNEPDKSLEEFTYIRASFGVEAVVLLPERKETRRNDWAGGLFTFYGLEAGRSDGERSWGIGVLFAENTEDSFWEGREQENVRYYEYFFELGGIRKDQVFGHRRKQNFWLMLSSQLGAGYRLYRGDERLSAGTADPLTVDKSKFTRHGMIFEMGFVIDAGFGLRSGRGIVVSYAPLVLSLGVNAGSGLHLGILSFAYEF